MEECGLNGTTRCTALCTLLALLQTGCRLTPPQTDTGSLRVTVVDGETGSPVGGVSTRLGTGLDTRTAITNSAGNAEFDDVIIGPLPLTIADSRACGAAKHVDVVGTGLTKVVVRLCDDRVAPSNAAGQPLVALLDITTHGPDGAGACTNDAIVQGIGVAELGVNALPTGKCPGAVAIYTRQHAIAYSRDATAMPWTSQLGDVYGVPVPADPLRVPIHVMLTDSALGSLMATQLLAAQQSLDYSYAGIQLVGSSTGGPPEMTTATPAQVNIIGQDCSSVMAIKQNPALYAAGRLNVYAVPSVNGGRQAVTCASELAPNIIFIKPDMSAVNTLAHEIGHALGLLRPAWGHTDPLRFFARSNLMYSMGTIEQSPYFSIGQVTRMTFDVTSWVNLPSDSFGLSLRSRLAAPLPTPMTIACACPENEATDACPALNRDIPRSVPFEQGNDEVRACGVDHISESQLVCNIPKLVTATFSPVDAPGTALWFSSDPSRLTIVPSPVDFVSATLTGHRNGPALVHVSASGSAATFTVTVAGCP
jgi:hypothetical protein